MNARRAAAFFLLRRAARIPPRALWRMVRRRAVFWFDSFAPARWSAADPTDPATAEAAEAALRALMERPLFPIPGAEADARTPHTPGAQAAAENILAGKVEIFGTAHNIGAPPINWRRDFRSGIDWPLAPAARIRVTRLDEPCDIKVPWELSRLQWLFPLAGAWRRTGDDRHAAYIRAVIEDWDTQNPVMRGPNWVSAMEAGLRGCALVWLAGACLNAPSWAEPAFRVRLSRMLRTHARFVSRHVEWADVNGNHVIACAVGLCVLGCALEGAGGGAQAEQGWAEQGWRIIRDELPRQTGADGVSFEASAAYHRFVLEMIVAAAAARRARGLPVEAEITERIAAMETFTAHCARTDGSFPAWGDDDGGRAPFCPSAPPAAKAPGSKAFPDAGVYILRCGDDHIFMDAGPAGMNGRGGHGHNDCLNTEIALCGAPLIIDPGTWTYTADYAARNRFRSAAAHNGPVVDGLEINRFVHPRLLWMLHDDAKPVVKSCELSPGGGAVTASHTGYERLNPPVRPERTVRLNGARHEAEITDTAAFAGTRSISIRYTLHPDVKAEITGAGRVRLNTPSAGAFAAVWEGEGWTAALEPAESSPGYGVLAQTSALVFSRTGPGPVRLTLRIAPEALAGASAGALANGAKPANLTP